MTRAPLKFFTILRTAASNWTAKARNLEGGDNFFICLKCKIIFLRRRNQVIIFNMHYRGEFSPVSNKEHEDKSGL